MGFAESMHTGPSVVASRRFGRVAERLGDLEVLRVGSPTRFRGSLRRGISAGGMERCSAREAKCVGLARDERWLEIETERNGL